MEIYKDILNKSDFDYLTIYDHDYKHQFISGYYATRVTTLMKLVILSHKYPSLNQYFHLYKHQINAKNSLGWTALHIACKQITQQNDVDTIKYLIECGANVNAQNFDNFVPICYLPAHRYGVAVAIMLLSTNSIDLNILVDNYKTIACKLLEKSLLTIDVLQILINNNWNINQIVDSKNETTILHIVSSKHMHNLINFLLKNGANPNALNKNKYNPLQCYLSASTIVEIETVKLFLNSGCDINNKTLLRNTSLELIIQNQDNLNLVKFCVQNGANINNLNTANKSLLVICATKNYSNSIKYLLKIGENPNTKCANYPLIIYCKNGNLKAIKSLLKYGANPNVVNCYGESAFNVISNIKEKIKIIKLLLKYGGLPNYSSQQYDSSQTLKSCY
jgi:ankyrin repeat protein